MLHYSIFQKELDIVLSILHQHYRALLMVSLILFQSIKIHLAKSTNQFQKEFLFQMQI